MRIAETNRPARSYNQEELMADPYETWLREKGKEQNSGITH